MRLALLLGRLPDASECLRAPIDGTAIVSLAASHGVVVAVDEDSPALAEVRAAGVPVHVSDKRHIHLPGGEQVDADEALARWLRARHEEQPFDLVIASPERPFQGQVRRTLTDVPWGCLLGAGPMAFARRLGLDERWVGSHGHELWAAASNVAAADVVIASTPPSGLGLRDVPTRALFEPPVPMLADRAVGELVVVVATGLSHLDAPLLHDALRSAVELDSRTTVVIVHGPDLPDATPVGPAIAAGLSADLSTQVLLVGADRLGQAGAWVEAADALVLLDEAELMVPVVARRTRTVPTVLLDRTAPGWRAPSMVLEPVTPAGPGRVGLLSWSGGRATAEELRALLRTSDLDLIVLHAPEAVREAERWLSMPGLSRSDVVVGARARPPWGMGDPKQLDAALLGLHRRTWAAVLEPIEDAEDLGALVARVADLSGARSHTLSIVASSRAEPSWVAPSCGSAPLSMTHGPLPELRVPVPAPDRTTEDAGRAPASASASTTSPPTAGVRDWARSSRWATRARAALPWRFGLRKAIATGEFPTEVVRWIRRHPIQERARLVLPWRWGLLPRAMEDRW